MPSSGETSVSARYGSKKKLPTESQYFLFRDDSAFFFVTSLIGLINSPANVFAGSLSIKNGNKRTSEKSPGWKTAFLLSVLMT